MIKSNITQDIRALCRKYTELSKEKIDYLENYANEIAKSSNYRDIDVFIDVWNPITSEAVVVWHYKPVNTESLYAKRVVGQSALRKDEPGPIRTLITGNASINLFAISQEGTYIKQTSYPIMYEDEVIGVLISEIKHDQAPNSNYEIENKPGDNHSLLSYQRLFDELEEIVMVFRTDGMLVYHNKACDKLYKEIGYLNEIKGLTFDNLSLDNTQFEEVKSLEADQVLEGEVKFWKYYLTKKIFLDKSLHYIQILTNKSKQRQVESVIENELVAVQEIHHRVKNNLQTVVSLLRLQARRTDSSEAKKALTESINRILSITVTHELLSTRKVDTVNLKKVVDAIVDNVVYAASREIVLEKMIDEMITLDSEQAVSIGLVINEIIQNAIEHAFIDKANVGDEAKIRIIIEENQNFIQIAISDNGVGFNFKDSSQFNLGLQIVSSFVKTKLKGLIVFEANNPGTLVRINFYNTLNKE